MRKLDATLVAYLAGETKLQSKELEPELELELDLHSQNESNVDDNDKYVLEEFVDPVVETVETITREELQLFRRIKSMKLQMEALTLEPEGTKRMELLQNDTRPIFTVECQLSHELIQNLPRYEMFHIMQFESEKFHSLTQCTRFGQEAQRDINLTPLIDKLDNTLNGNCSDSVAGDAPNFGRIHFAVWWREPGTCLNEMLGMGVFELRELYDAALLEQCKRITIQRRGVPLAKIYLKINLLLCTLADTNNNKNNNSADLSCEAASQAMKQHPGGGKKKKGGSGKSGAQSSTSGSAAAANTSATSSNTTGEYQVERLLYLKDTDIQWLRTMRVRVCANPPLVGESKQQHNGSNENSENIIVSSNYTILQKSNFITITNHCGDDFIFDLVFVIISYDFRDATFEQDRFLFVIFLDWFTLDIIINILNIVEENEQEKTKEKKNKKTNFVFLFIFMYLYIHYVCMHFMI